VFFEAYPSRFESGVFTLAKSEPGAIQQPIDIAGERMFGTFHRSTISDPKLVLTKTFLQNTILPKTSSRCLSMSATSLTVKGDENMSDPSATLQRPVILMNGMGSNFDSLWRRNGWVDKLQAAGRTVIGVDLPGHGASKDLVGRDAADLILNEAAKHGSVDAIGFSAGAWALLLAASERPALFERIAVLGAADAVMTHEMYTAAMNQPIIDGLRSSEPTDNPMVTVIRAMIADAGNDSDAIAGYLASDKRFVSVEGLGRITADALVIDSSGDGAGQSDLVAKTIPGAQHVTLEGPDHFEIPGVAQCVDATISFIDSDGSRVSK
jgi:pimeloyl-ACP methyl ester carboxylesterase